MAMFVRVSLLYMYGAVQIGHAQSQTLPSETQSAPGSTVMQVGFINDRQNTTRKSREITFSVESSKVTTVMGEETTVSLNYTIDCGSRPRDAYHFSASLSQDNVVSIVKVKPQAAKDVFAACASIPGGVLSGSLDVVLQGDLPGRSQLYIDAVEGDTNGIEEPLQIVLKNASTKEINVNDSFSYSIISGSAYDTGGNSSWTVINEPFPARLSVICKKEQTTLDTVFQIMMVLFLICLMVSMGCKTELHVLREVWHKPIAPIIGLSCQSVLMPLIGFGLTMAAHFPSQTMALGFFACGCAPGGGASNFYTYLLNGDVTLSVTMTTISNLTAIGIFPLWIFTLGRLVLTDQSEVKMPYANLVISLLMIALPLSLGMGLKFKRPQFTKRLIKVLIPLTIILIVIVPVIGLYLNFYMLRLMTLTLVAVSFFLPNLGFLCGFVLARIFKQSWKFSRTVAIETGVQNVGVAFVLVMFSFSQPDNVLAAIPAVTSSMMTSIPLLAAAAIYHMYLRYNKNKDKGTSVPYSIQYTQSEDNADPSDTSQREHEVMWERTVM